MRAQDEPIIDLKYPSRLLISHWEQSHGCHPEDVKTIQENNFFVRGNILALAVLLDASCWKLNFKILRVNRIHCQTITMKPITGRQFRHIMTIYYFPNEGYALS